MQLALRKPTKKKRRDGRVRSQKHRNWVCKHACLVDNCINEKMHAHHVRDRSNGGTSIKPGDEWTVPLCGYHHPEGHNIGWQTFEEKYDLNLREAALWFAKRSPDPAIKDAVKDE